MAGRDFRRGRRTTDQSGVREGRITRIRIPQPERKPLDINEREIIRRSLLDEDPQWFVLHRRGVRRPWVGADPLESRAVSRASVIGYLHERIVYRWLTVAGFRPGLDFDYQSSEQGGRLELGGMVVDFLFPYLQIAFSILGPQHEEQLRKAKDKEQAQILREMGFWPIGITTAMVEDEYMFNKFMMDTFVSGNRVPPPVVGIINIHDHDPDYIDQAFEALDAFREDWNSA